MNQTHLGEPLFSPPQAIFVKGGPFTNHEFSTEIAKGGPFTNHGFSTEIAKGDPLQICYFHKPTEITKGDPLQFTNSECSTEIATGALQIPTGIHCLARLQNSKVRHGGFS